MIGRGRAGPAAVRGIRQSSRSSDPATWWTSGISRSGHRSSTVAARGRRDSPTRIGRYDRSPRRSSMERRGSRAVRRTGVASRVAVHATPLNGVFALAPSGIEGRSNRAHGLPPVGRVVRSGAVWSRRGSVLSFDTPIVSAGIGPSASQVSGYRCLPSIGLRAARSRSSFASTWWASSEMRLRLHRSWRISADPARLRAMTFTLSPEQRDR